MNMTVAKPIVLVVDDNPEDLATGCRVVGSRWPVLAAASGEDALRIARKACPAAIVLDVMMAGGMDGFAVYRELRRDPATSGIPVIFLTNVNRMTGLAFGPKDIHAYLGGRPAAFLEKPVSPDSLTQALTQALAHAGKADR